MKFNSFNSFFVVVDLIVVIMTMIFTTKLIILNKFKADELMFFKFKPVEIFTLHGFISQCL